MCAMGGMGLSQGNAEKTSNAIFLIGLGILFMGGIPFWPGILFVIGFSSLARGLAEGKSWYGMQSALWTIGVGVMFYFGFNWPIILILVGLSMLLGITFKPPMFRASGEDDAIRAERKAKRKSKLDGGFEYYDEEDLA